MPPALLLALAWEHELETPEEKSAAALAEERYENEALYPRMIRDLEDTGEARAPDLDELRHGRALKLRELAALGREGVA